MRALNPHFLYIVPATVAVYTTSAIILLIRFRFPRLVVVRRLLVVLTVSLLLLLLLGAAIVIGNSYSGIGDFLLSAWAETQGLRLWQILTTSMGLENGLIILAELASPVTFLLGAFALIVGVTKGKEGSKSTPD